MVDKSLVQVLTIRKVEIFVSVVQNPLCDALLLTCDAGIVSKMWTMSLAHGAARGTKSVTAAQNLTRYTRTITEGQTTFARGTVVCVSQSYLI